MSIQSQKKNMKAIHGLLSQDLGYIHGERESGPNGAKKEFHTKSAAFMRALGNDLGLQEFKVHKNYVGIAVSGEITLMGMWSEGNGVYFELTQNIFGSKDFLYRHMTHMKDHSSGANRWLDYGLFAIADYEGLLDALFELRNPSDEVNRHVA